MAKKKAKPGAEAGETFRLAKRPTTPEEMRTAGMDGLDYALNTPRISWLLSQEFKDVMYAFRGFVAAMPAEELQKVLNLMPKRP